MSGKQAESKILSSQQCMMYFNLLGFALCPDTETERLLGQQHKHLKSCCNLEAFNANYIWVHKALTINRVLLRTFSSEPFSNYQNKTRHFHFLIFFKERMQRPQDKWEPVMRKTVGFFTRRHNVMGKQDTLPFVLNCLLTMHLINLQFCCNAVLGAYSAAEL